MADTPNVFVNWDVLEAAIAAAFPNHRIVRGMLLEDFNNTPAGRLLRPHHHLRPHARHEGQTTPERRNDKDSDSDN